MATIIDLNCALDSALLLRLPAYRRKLRGADLFVLPVRCKSALVLLEEHLADGHHFGLRAQVFPYMLVDLSAVRIVLSTTSRCMRLSLIVRILLEARHGRRREHSRVRASHSLSLLRPDPAIVSLTSLCAGVLVPTCAILVSDCRRRVVAMPSRQELIL